MYEDIYNKIVEYLKENSGVFYSIISKGKNPTYYEVEVNNNDIYISTPNNTPKPTTVNEKLNKSDFYKIYPLFLEYLAAAKHNVDIINKDALLKLNNESQTISGRRIYWIGLFFELTKRGVI